METKRVSARELIDFIEKNYLYNVWYSGISKLVEMYPTVGDFNAFYEVEIIRKTIFEGNKYGSDNNYSLDVVLTYENYWCRDLSICKKNDVFYLLSNIFSFEGQKHILSEIDFSNLYEYYIKNEFPNNKYYVDAIYSSSYGKCNMKVEFKDGNLIAVGKPAYNIKCHIESGKMIVDESYGDFRSPITYEIKGLYAQDPNFLDNITVAFEDLPTYIQETLYNNPFDKDKKDENKEKGLKMVLDRFLRKPFNKDKK